MKCFCRRWRSWESRKAAWTTMPSCAITCLRASRISACWRRCTRTLRCYHVPAGEQDLSVLETLYENPAVTGIRIMENSIYDVARKLHLANYDGKPAYGEIESLMQELRTKIEKESDYFIYFISINGSIDGTLIEVLNSLEEYYTRSNDDELVYHVPLDQADLSVLRTLIGHPAVEEIWITGTPYADVPTEHSETL